MSEARHRDPEAIRAALLPTRYLPALDGLRAVAVVLVIASHAAPAHLVPGGFGVTLFFFLSGYLLTGQMVAEQARTGGIAFGGFYLRRVLRLMPAALAFLLVAGLAFAAWGGTITPAGWLSALFYGANLYEVFSGYASDLPVAGASGAMVPHPFAILWSLAIEEQFYLVWPVLLLGLLRRGGWRGAAWGLAGACLAALVWRACLYRLCLQGAPGAVCGVEWYNRLYAGTDTRLDSLAFGALAAVLVVRGDPRRLAALVGARGVQAAAWLVLAGSLAWRDPYFREVVRYTVQGLALAVVLAPLVARPGPGRRLLESGPMLFLGRISYSLYLWHWFAAMLASHLVPPRGPGFVALYLALTAALSLASWYGIERPMIALRRRAGSHARAAGPSEGPAPRAGARAGSAA
ncbi:acyltransferase family protein [Methylobacterium oryzihabitans]|uniref:acyltransferase family protein n=1 Tax=Methylobacterium oryzihabitans TaxID=2499852 RepID=UPI00165282C6|nr:acyltransferase [Methylobacterium oryzihabitans]